MGHPAVGAQLARQVSNMVNLAKRIPGLDLGWWNMVGSLVAEKTIRWLRTLVGRLGTMLGGASSGLSTSANKTAKELLLYAVRWWLVAAGRLLKTAAPVLITAFAVRLYSLRQEYREYSQIQHPHPLDDPRSERTRQRRKTRRVAARWFKSQGTLDPVEHPFVFRLHAELGGMPLNSDWRLAGTRRLQRWFNELPTLEMAIGKHMKVIVGEEPTRQDFLDEDGEVIEAAFRAAWLAWKDQWELVLDEQRARYRENPRQWTIRMLGADHPGLRPEPGTEYRLCQQLLAATLKMRAEETNVDRYVLGLDEIQEAAHASEDLERPRSLAALLAGVMSWRDYLAPTLPLPRSK